jgi:hypothetical protein
MSNASYRKCSRMAERGRQRVDGQWVMAELLANAPGRNLSRAC